MLRFLVGPTLCALILGCAGGQRAKAPIGSSDEFEQSTLNQPDASGDEPSEAPPEDVVQRAERPFFGYRLLDGKQLGPEELLTTLASADAICVGERHDDAGDHYAELRTLTGLLERRAMRGFELGLGLEMVRTEYQGPLSRFGAFLLDPETFEERVHWESEWGFPIQYYRPQLLTARARGAQLLALGVAQGVTRKIASDGLDGLDSYELGRLPELDLNVARHRSVFDQLMQGHPGAQDDDLERYYQAQVVWDESMAETSAQWLLDRHPGRKVLILAGTAHCHRDAIPRRFTRRTGLTAVSLLPVHGGKAIARGAKANIDEVIAQGYEFQMVFEP